MSVIRFFLFAGEPSGDLHGSHLLRTLKSRIPAAIYSGVGGPLMRTEGLETFMPMENFEVMGFSDVMHSLPRLIRQFLHIRNEILESRPDAVILIDYPGFNLRMARSLRKHGYAGKIVHYISPTVWAWGKNRIHTMAKTLDMLLTIYPFEKDHFKGTSLKVEYVGNPLHEYVKSHNYRSDWSEEFGIKKDRPCIALFPGSRKQEIERNLPIQLHAAAQLKQFAIAISCGHADAIPLIMDSLKQTSLQIGKDVHLIPKEYSYSLMKTSYAAIAKSGTVTLELALHSCPTVVSYQLTPLNRFLAKHIFKVNLPYYCIVNLLANRQVFPELIETKPSVEKLHAALHGLVYDAHIRQQTIHGCRHVQDLLGTHSASFNAAQLIEELL